MIHNSDYACREIVTCSLGYFAEKGSFWILLLLLLLTMTEEADSMVLVTTSGRAVSTAASEREKNSLALENGM